MTQDAEAGATAAMIVAAGASTRLGRPKQLVELRGEPLLLRAARIAAEAGCQPVLVVLGAQGQRIADAVRARPAWPADKAVLLTNPAWQEGMGASIRRGLEYLDAQRTSSHEPAGCLILTCDQPLVTAAHLRALARRAPSEITASAYASRHGVPAYFPRAAFAALRTLRGDAGARTYLQSAAALACPEAAWDIDTEDDVVRLQTMAET